MTTTDYRIESEGHLMPGHMRAPAEHLKGEIEYMATCVKLARREDLTPEETEFMEDHGVGGDPDDFDPFESWALEVKRANWLNSQGWAATNSDPARLLIVLGTGGPHVELSLDFDRGQCESIELRRYWSGKDSAKTTDTRALAIVDEFYAAFLDY